MSYLCTTKSKEMNDCFNIAVSYLKNKYGVRRVCLTGPALKRLYSVSKKRRKELEASLTDRDYVEELNPVSEESDKVILMLMGQYYYGMQPREELYNKLMEMGIVKE